MPAIQTYAEREAFHNRIRNKTKRMKRKVRATGRKRFKPEDYYPIIKQYHDEGFTYEDIAIALHLTTRRIRQIVREVEGPMQMVRVPVA